MHARMITFEKLWSVTYGANCQPVISLMHPRQLPDQLCLRDGSMPIVTCMIGQSQRTSCDVLVSR
jgi:hypothetical protein